MTQIVAAAGPPPGPPPGLAPAGRDAELRAAAQALEGAFLSEMLKAAGVGAPREGLGGGGIGEEQFASMLRDVHAGALAERGGIGIAEAIYRAMTAAPDGS